MENAQNSASEIKKDVVFGTIGVDSVLLNELNKKYFSAQLRQVVSTTAHYPAARPNSGLNDGLFAVEDFDIKSEPMESTQQRLVWIDVPVGTTEDQVKGILAANPNAKIVRIVSNTPIISASQQSVIDDVTSTLTKDQVAMRQLIQYPAGSTDAKGASNAGEIAKDSNGKLQYAINVFSMDGSKSDSDTRDADPENSYVPTPLVMNTEKTVI